MKLLLGVALCLFCTLVGANTGALSLAIPSAPGSYLSDRFRAGELDCSMAIGSGVNVEFGVVGVLGYGNPYGVSQVTTDPNTNIQTKDVGVYGRIIIPIGMPKGRIDCTILYDLELKKRAMEIEKLEAEIRNLKNLKFENGTK